MKGRESDHSLGKHATLAVRDANAIEISRDAIGVVVKVLGVNV